MEKVDLNHFSKSIAWPKNPAQPWDVPTCWAVERWLSTSENAITVEVEIQTTFKKVAMVFFRTQGENMILLHLPSRHLCRSPPIPPSASLWMEISPAADKFALPLLLPVPVFFGLFTLLIPKGGWVGFWQWPLFLIPAREANQSPASASTRV